MSDWSRHHRERRRRTRRRTRRRPRGPRRRQPLDEEGTPVESDSDLAAVESPEVGLTPLSLGIAEYWSVVVPGTADGDAPVRLFARSYVAVLPAADLVAHADRSPPGSASPSAPVTATTSSRPGRAPLPNWPNWLSAPTAPTASPSSSSGASSGTERPVSTPSLRARGPVRHHGHEQVDDQRGDRGHRTPPWGIDVRETEPGDFGIEEADEAPSYVVGTAIDKSRAAIAKFPGRFDPDRPLETGTCPSSPGSASPSGRAGRTWRRRALGHRPFPVTESAGRGY
jgi:hypothetical protein